MLALCGVFFFLSPDLLLLFPNRGESAYAKK
jgi:hypothetical protein